MAAIPLVKLEGQIYIQLHMSKKALFVSLGGLGQTLQPFAERCSYETILRDFKLHFRSWWRKASQFEPNKRLVPNKEVNA